MNIHTFNQYYKHDELKDIRSGWKNADTVNRVLLSCAQDNVVFFSTNNNDISYAHFPASRLAPHSTNLALVFLCIMDHSALWCITECKSHAATWLLVFYFFWLCIINIGSSSEGSSRVNFSVCPPTAEWGHCSFRFLKMICWKQRGQCCLLCPNVLDAADICLCNRNPVGYIQHDWVRIFAECWWNLYLQTHTLIHTPLQITQRVYNTVEAELCL